MTYFRIEFVDLHGVPTSKVFRTREQAKEHAKRVLGFSGECDLDSKIAITRITKTK